ncbi:MULTISPECIES: arylamine N-acetyltransferase family protein [Tenebrionibacter/Tenebrionicola group]|uniref:Arylamine N-acetyltransferase n=2 Tax=Tenebrionibacter/Tenebrionicola group TaxID=2969848 RepID=A0A8K0V8J2_9ENTR|nr:MULTISPECIES: arylamine N-acetyltransferase [Tenebrionibacter/Tenebrionicola group]MBK4716232.1 arylamine N-acetyltransferase [Tenebrionibacter intestinalis]MBV4411302.1 arylamine N-acetyltransferase [Tenebrionicola larvae]MBV5096887.1 arylamine N-acetyltransferase [Tenebrionicola larvae]
MEFSLSDYLTRIGWPHAVPQPGVSTLRELHLRHACAIPFENLDVLLGRTVHIDQTALFAKLVHARRGGWCYEQNGLFQQALEALGFEVESLAARVVMAGPATMPPRTHRMLCVTFAAERWLADVGFGGASLSTPIRLCAGQEQRTAHGLYRLDNTPEGWLLLAHQHNAWQRLYLFDESRAYFSDYLMANHFVSTWPDSHFLRHLMVSRWLTDGGQLRLLNCRLTRRAPDGSEAEQTLTPEQVFRSLKQDFGLCLDHAQYGIRLQELQSVLKRCG